MRLGAQSVDVAAAEDKNASKLKRTLSNGGLYPQPEAGKMVRRPSGSMAVFTEGGSALGGAESGNAA